MRNQKVKEGVVKLDSRTKIISNYMDKFKYNMNTHSYHELMSMVHDLGEECIRLKSEVNGNYQAYESERMKRYELEQTLKTLQEKATFHQKEYVAIKKKLDATFNRKLTWKERILGKTSSKMQY